MTCYHPLKRWVIGQRYNKDGELVEKAKITSYKAENPLDEIDNFKYEMKHGKPLKMTNFQEIPCGKCIGCRLDYAKNWANRCMLEAKEHEENQFITLTYNDENLKKVKGVINFETGEIGEAATLVPEHLMKFMKDLRRYYEYHYNHKGIRFYACGEYGKTETYIDNKGNVKKGTGRPHYHIIAYNLPIKDKKLDYIDSKTGYRYYQSDTLQKEIWKKGIVEIADVNWETCAYVARYVMKKIKGKEAVEIFRDTGLIQEFVRMSRRPGIGKTFYEKNKDKIYETDEMFIKNAKGVQKVKPSRYYDKLYDIDEPEKMAAIKEARKKAAEEAEKIRESESEFDKLEYLQIKENIKEEQIKRLKRRV